MPWRGPLGTNPSGRGSSSNSGREPRRRHTEESATCETLGGAGNTRKVDGSAYRIGSRYPPGRIWRAGDGGGSNMHEGGLSPPIDSEAYKEMRLMSSSTSRMASPAVRALHRSVGLASFRATNICYSLPGASSKRKRHFRLGGPVCADSLELRRDEECRICMSCQDEGFAGAPAVKGWGLGPRGRNLALRLVNGLSATPD